MKRKLLRRLLAVMAAVMGMVVFILFEWYNSPAYELARYQKHMVLFDNFKNSKFENLSQLAKRDRPDLAYLQDFERTKDPLLGYPPEERRLQAFEIVKERHDKLKSLKSIENVVWEERGPNNVGGRTRALMFDPNDAETKKVFAGSVSGGLWYNDDITDPNSTWNAIDDFMANLSISSIIYNPTNPTNFYVGTGEGFGAGTRGAGIWESLDAGSTWTQLSSTTNEDFYFVQKILFTSQGTLLAATSSGTYRSVDSGKNWTKVIDERGADVEISSDETLYVSVGLSNDDGFIYRSVDDGLNWVDITPADNGQRIELGIAPSNANVLYAVSDGGGSGSDEIGYFVKSSDKGENWENVSIPAYTEQTCELSDDHFTRGQAWYDLILGVMPEDENALIVGGIDLNRSTDAGMSWELISYWTGGCDDLVHADQHIIVFRPGYPNEAIFGNDGGVYYSGNIADPDPFFESRNNGYNVTQFYAVAAENNISANYYLAGAQDNGTQQLSLSGVGKSFEVTGGDGGYCFVDQNDPMYQVTSYVYNSYYLSQDGGKTFITISDDQSKGFFINPSEYDSDAKTIYGSGNTNEITRIADVNDPISGLKLETISIDMGGSLSHIKTSPYSENVLFVGGNGSKKVAVISGANGTSPTVTDISGNLAGTAGSISSIDIGATELHLLVTYSNYGVISVYETTDGGINWINKEGNLPDMPIRWGIFNPNNRNEVLLATEVGVWSTDNISVAVPEWSPTNSDLANVRCDMIKYREADGQIIVATHGRGVFTSNVFATSPNADFEIDRLIAYAGEVIEFRDHSLVPNDNWNWSFGDEGSSDLQNPTYTFTSPGTYDITLSIDNNKSETVKELIVLPSKSAPYSLSDGGDFESNQSDFIGISLLNEEVLWELGTPSGRLSTLSSGTKAWKTGLGANLEDKGYNYKAALYTPAFDFTEQGKEYTMKFKKSMENGFCNAPMAMQLQYSTDAGVKWKTLGTSEPAYGSINWYNRGENDCALVNSIFENQTGWSYTTITDQTDDSVDDENTEFKLNFLIGESSVSFRFVVSVVTGYGEGYDRDGFMIDDFEIQLSDPVAEFDVDNNIIAAGGELQFNYLSIEADTFDWDFGDGTTSNLENPSHIYSEAGSYTVSLTITSDAGTVVETKNNYVTVLPKYVPPYLEINGGNFEVDQSDFVAENITGTSFELGKSEVEGKNGTASGDYAWVTGIDDAEYLDESEARLYSPVFDFSELLSYNLSFKSNYSFESNWDGFIVEYSKDLGSSWQKLNDNSESAWYNQISDPQSVFGVSVPIFSGNTNGQFEVFSTDVTFLAEENDVMFRFLFLSDANTVDVGMAIDDFEISSENLLKAQADFEITGGQGCSGHTVTFTNQSTGSIASYNWDFGSGATPEVAEGIGPHDVIYKSDIPVLSNVKLIVDGVLNGTVVEEKIDVISTGPTHEPLISEEIINEVITLMVTEGDSYQWFIDDIEIEGAVGQSYTASKSGAYYVNVFVSGCSRFSSNYDLEVITSIRNGKLIDNTIEIYPNPSSGIFTLKNEAGGMDQIMVNIYDLTGKKLHEYLKVITQNRSIAQIDLSDLTQGTYMIEISSPNLREIKRIAIK